MILKIKLQTHIFGQIKLNSMRGFLLGIAVLFSLTVFAQKTKKPSSGYDVIHPFKNGIAKVEKEKKQGFINEAGEEFVPVKYDQIYPWEKGRAKVEIAGKYGFINEQGEEYIPVKYDFIGPFKNGLAISYLMLGQFYIKNQSFCLVHHSKRRQISLKQQHRHQRLGIRFRTQVLINTMEVCI